MSEESINETYEEVVSLIEQRRLHEAFENVKIGLLESRCWDLQSSFDTISTTYELMGQYMLQGVRDPKQQEMYESVVAKLLEITDRIHILLLDKESPKLYHILRNRISRNSDLPELMRLVQELQSVTMDISVGKLLPDKQKQADNADKWYRLEKLLFEKVWTNTTWSSDDEETANYILESSPLTQTDTCLFVGAVTMSLLQCLDISKLLWLFKAYSDDKLSAKVRQRAIIGIFFVLHTYPDRLAHYPKLKVRISLLKEQRDFARDISQCYINFIQCRETERITNIMNNEIVPDIIKGMNKSDNDAMPKGEDADAPKIIMPNIEDKEIQAKLERLTKMSMEGGDLYMSTFQNLKGFSFFHDVENWFKPFDLDQPSVLRLQDVGDKTNNTILNILKSTIYLCDNDKYSLVHLLPKMPLQQFDMMKEQLEQAEDMLNEQQMSDELFEKDEADNKLQNINYFHELYRFFKASPRKNEFNDIFKINPFNHEQDAVNTALCNWNQWMLLAEFLFKKKYWFDAAFCYEDLIETTDDIEKKGTLCTHLGYAYQMLSRFKTAIEWYEKAELFIQENDWIKRQKGTCEIYMSEYGKALLYFQDLLNKNPESIKLMLQTAICLGYSDKTEEALNLLFKVNLIQPNNTKAWRYIGMFSFFGDKFEQAKKYYDMLTATSDANMDDFLTLGHVEWLLHNLPAALKNYQRSKQFMGDKTTFIDIFNADLNIILKKGINKDDIPLMLDMV
jgi:tetratricopeptide (TPR) repeat protein